MKPKVGDFVRACGRYGIVTSFTEDGKVRVMHLRRPGRPRAYMMSDLKPVHNRLITVLVGFLAWLLADAFGLTEIIVVMLTTITGSNSSWVAFGGEIIAFVAGCIVALAAEKMVERRYKRQARKITGYDE